MKDDEKVELRVGDIKRAAEKCGTAKEILKELFPDVFKVAPPEWEDVTKLAYIVSWCGKDLLLCVNDDDSTGSIGSWSHRGVIKLDHDGTWGPTGDDTTQLKIENGKLWRRKSA